MDGRERFGCFMGSGREYSSSQRKIISRYYDQIDTIVLTRLGEIATDMILAGGDAKKLDRLWKRAEQALAKVETNDGQKDLEKDPAIEKILALRDIEALGKLITKLNR